LLFAVLAAVVAADQIVAARRRGAGEPSLLERVEATPK
jgi:hypothetical protein